MLVHRVTGFYFLLSAHCAAPSDVSSSPQHHHADTGGPSRDQEPDASAVLDSGFEDGEPNRDQGPDASAVLDSGFEDGEPNFVPDHYPYDVFWQSGGVRVRAENLNQEGQKTYRHFLHHERQEQRAFIWRKLHLENINFVHLGTENPMIRKAWAKDITEEDMPTFKEILGFDTLEEISTLFQSLGASLNLLHDVAWDMKAIYGVTWDAPLYNDMPGASTSGDSAASRAYNDPRYRNSNVVVNYRANSRTLLFECLRLLTYNVEFSAELGIHVLKNAFEDTLENTDVALHNDPQERRKFISQQVEARLDPLSFFIDINVDAVPSNVAPRTVYQAITKGIEACIEETHNGAQSVPDAIRELQQIANEETARANRYAAFNSPGTPDLPELRVGRERRLRDDINDVHARAIIRRKELHKMTEPFAVSAESATTYRVHFSDPEHRFCSTCAGFAAHPKKYYQAIWTRLLEPAFRDVIVDTVPDPVLRDIVLIDNEPNRAVAYVLRRGGEHVIVHCDLLKADPWHAVRIIRHEYEHTVDGTMKFRASQRLKEMQNEHDLRTLTSDTLQDKIREFHEIRSNESQQDARQKFMNTKRLMAAQIEFQELSNQMKSLRQYTFNADGLFGFPTYYARKNSFETIAEQRYAMRTELRRTALLRRMSQCAAPGPRQADAERQKMFYDAAREEMKHVAPDLWKQWGENYDGRSVREWGLFPGETAKTDKRYQIMALDHTIATNTASEKIATKLLAHGYDVSVTTYSAELSRSVPELQSTMEEPHPGEPCPPFEVLIVAGLTANGMAIANNLFSYFRYFTPMGRTNVDGSIDQINLKAVTIVRVPDQSFHPLVENNEEMRRAFADEWELKSGHDAPPIVVHDGHVAVTHHGRIVSAERSLSVWSHDSNHYGDTIFQEWIDRFEEVSKLVGQMECRTVP